MRDLDHKRLNLTRIPKYLVHGTVKGNRFLVMEFLEMSIKEYLKEVSDCPIKWRKRICEVAVQMLKAVEEFHRTIKVHRDIKPDNFRVHKGKVYIIEFGSILDYRKDGMHVGKTIGYAFKGTL